MKIHILSDLHFDVSAYEPSAAAYAADVIVLAGDIWKKDFGVHTARALFPDQPIVMVMGNHEHYGQDLSSNVTRIRKAAAEAKIYLLENDEVIIDGTRFLGCTLWTDFALYGRDRFSICTKEAQKRLNDFRLIKNGDAKLTPIDTVKIHKQSVQWLETKLDETFDGPTVVVTHHAPTRHSVVPRFQGDLLSACFASQLDQLMGKCELWLHGHMHDSLDYTVEGTRVICNPRGYSRYVGTQENKQFNPSLLIDVKKGLVEIVEADEEDIKLPKPRTMTAMQVEAALEAIDALPQVVYNDIDFKFVDIALLEPELFSHAREIALMQGYAMEGVYGHDPEFPVSSFFIKSIKEEIIERSEHAVRLKI